MKRDNYKMSTEKNNKTLHVVTPLIESLELSKTCGEKVYMKLENTQPSGSFKIRGIGHLIQNGVTSRGIKGIVSSSGGNAGMAAAYSARQLNVPATVILPSSTPHSIKEKLQALGATVEVHGAIWNEANERALEISEQQGLLYVHPFHHPLIWVGNSTLVDEVIQQCGPTPPGSIVMAVGGGGLMCGVLEGLIRHNLSHVPVLAMETVGADCFNVAIKSGKPVSIGNITSLAKTLGALSVSERVFELLPQVKVLSRVVTDKEAVDAIDKFATDHRYLVEPSCGAALAACYSGVIKKLLQDGTLKAPVIMVVCGGNAVDVTMIRNWKIQTGLIDA